MAAARVSRFYTSARRHPWVLGKVGDWKIPLGPYTPAQIVVFVGGGFVLFKTISWWSWLGPVPLVLWLLAVWAVRRPTIRGRAPMQAALGWVLLACQPQGGRIGGRAARDRAPRALLGGFTIEALVEDFGAGRCRPVLPCAGAPRSRRSEPAVPARAAGPVSGVQHLVALAQQGGAR
ncbi:hypothetical protein [Streptomyces sp. NPDC004286]|uniref:hypothetical protein n=1 Tax=Streptomyces sp. NPDC004286 TaxID=3364696 RepID=UPI0036A16F22